MGNEAVFWTNLKNLKHFWQVSLTDVCNALNKEVPGLGMTKGKLNYILCNKPDLIPADGIVDAVNKLYCHGCGLGYDEPSILDHPLNANELSLLVTGQHIQECSMDIDSWTENFWSNYKWIEICHQQVGIAVPIWKTAGNYTYKLRKNRNILPPAGVLEEFARLAGLDVPYPVTYLKRFDGREMLLAYKRIVAPFIPCRPDGDAGSMAEACARLAVDATTVRMIMSVFPMHIGKDREDAMDEAVSEADGRLKEILESFEKEIGMLWNRGK